MANENAAAECPDGKEAEIGIRTLVATGPPARTGRRHLATGLIAKLLTVAVTAIEASPAPAA